MVVIGGEERVRKTERINDFSFTHQLCLLCTCTHQGTINILRKGLEGGWWVPKILRYIVHRGRGPLYLSYGGWVVILAA